MKIKNESQEKEIDLQKIYDIVTERELFNKEIIFFVSMLPIIKEIEIIFSYHCDYIFLKFENQKKLKIYDKELSSYLYDIFLDD